MAEREYTTGKACRDIKAGRDVHEVIKLIANTKYKQGYDAGKNVEAALNEANMKSLTD